MEQQKWEKIDAIVDGALELEGEERAAYIEKQCSGDEELQFRVTELLSSIEEAGDKGFLDSSIEFTKEIAAIEGAEKDSTSASSMVGQTVDNYHILKLLAHGGMGSVFLAERADDAYQGTVALKLLRRGMDTPSNIARFRRERNILAGLHHPNIARLLDGGVTDEGLPYIVMEYVEGLPIYEYCNKHRLTVEERLNLFQSVCQAVQHAHQNAVIHRDLKPSNILVTRNEQVKILDFGIAKLTDPENPKSTLFKTQTGERILTHGYAAPEQVKGEPVTTATDTYVLGILLYELLAGVHPLDLKDKNISEVERFIKEETPAYPSVKLAELSSEQQSTIAYKRNISAQALTQLMSGDLNAIVLKALRKEPAHRYSTVQALLDDLNYHRTDKPVTARSGTWRYYSGKFVRRHRWGVGTAVVAMVLIACFITALVWQVQKTARQRDRAVAAVTFLKDMLSISDPETGAGGSIPVSVLLQKGAVRLDTSFADQPLLKADLLDIIGSAFRGYGLYKRALNLHRKALALRLSEEDAKKLAIADTRNNIGEIFYYLDRPDSAAYYYHKSLKVRRRLLGNLHVDIAQSLNNLALIDVYRENYDRAAKRMKKALSIFKYNLPANHWRVANALNNLAEIRLHQGALDKAKRLFRGSLAMLIHVKGKTHRDVARVQASIANILIREGKLNKAKTLLNKAMHITRISTTGNLPLVGQIMIELGKIQLRSGDFVEAEQYFRKAREQYREELPPRHRRQADALLGLGKALLAQNHTEKALKYARKAVAISKDALPPKHRRTAIARSFLGAVLTAMGYYKKAEQHLLKSHKVIQNHETPRAIRSLQLVNKNLAQLYKAWGKPRLAATYRDTIVVF